MENFVTCQKRMRAVDGKQEIYLEWPNGDILRKVFWPISAAVSYRALCLNIIVTL